MEKNMKKILTLSVLGMFMFMFAMPFIAAAGDTLISDWFTNWEEANMSANIAKYLFWALVSMAVFSIGCRIPVIKGLWGKKADGKDGSNILGWVFSIIVGFLSMAYITPSEVYVMMTSYSALGFVLSAVIPFIILAAFTFTLATDSAEEDTKQSLMNKVIAWIMWVAFVGFMIYRALGQKALNITIPAGFEFVQWIAIIVGVLIIALLGFVFKAVRKAIKQGQIKTYGEKSDTHAEVLNADDAAVKKTSKK